MQLQNILLFLVGLAVIIDSYDATCCKTPSGCFGKGQCNVLCCNCADGCVHGSRNILRPVHGNSEAAKIFKAADKDTDGELSFDEVVSYILKNDGNGDRLKHDQTWFASMDKNHDGVIQPNELDESLRQR